MPTIGDVARAAGVGVGTVSRVLNNRPFVSERVRQRVQAAIEQLQYQPSRTARAFGRRRTHTLELLVPLFAGSFFLEVLSGVEAALDGSDYTLLVRTMERAEDRERAFDECCSRGRADGAMVLWTVPTGRFVERIAAEPFPTVLLNVQQHGRSAFLVCRRRSRCGSARRSRVLHAHRPPPHCTGRPPRGRL
jgi:DNA-binding LacI/PurR family transcriptional regulator